MRSVRCAIYTRKSSEEGLEQGFNSLDAQREACAAYILSQASEGWSEVAERYDDGGLSGGTLERPALQRLLADVAARRIDIIVVYKVDRLTRSLLDFAKLVEAFDAADVSFVSITQSFNTTTSMGRLTLNMLLSFAQFEREVTAERIRDKIAASKAKGMWMGGNPPIGYRPNGRSLAIIDSEAAQVRDIFQRYLVLGNVRAVAEALIRDGITTPPRTNGKGRAYGGCPWSRGQIYKLLSNPIYLGLIEHKGTRYPGLHGAIIDQDSWEYAQAKLAENLQGRRTRSYARDPSLLAGKVTDAAGEPLIPVHASKSGDIGAGQTRYRYYVSKALHHGDCDTGMRIPARELEGLVVERVAALFDDPLQLMVDAALDVEARQIGALDEKCRALAAQVRQRKGPTIELIQGVRIDDAGVAIDVDGDTVAQATGCLRSPDAAGSVTLNLAARLTRSGRVMRLVHDSKAAAPPDRSIVGLLVRAHGWWNELRNGELDVGALAKREGVSGSYFTRVLRLAFLSPEATQTLLTGRQGRLNSGSLIASGAVPPLWREQVGMVGR